MLRPYNFVPFASFVVNPAFPDPTAASPIDLGELFLILIQLLVTINIGNGGSI